MPGVPWLDSPDRLDKLDALVTSGASSDGVFPEQPVRRKTEASIIMRFFMIIPPFVMVTSENLV